MSTNNVLSLPPSLWGEVILSKLTLPYILRLFQVNRTLFSTLSTLEVGRSLGQKFLTQHKDRCKLFDVISEIIFFYTPIEDCTPKIMEAALKGYEIVLNFLLPLGEFKYNLSSDAYLITSELIVGAIRKGYTEIATILLQYFDSPGKATLNFNRALSTTVASNNLLYLRELIEKRKNDTFRLDNRSFYNALTYQIHKLFRSKFFISEYCPSEAPRRNVSEDEETKFLEEVIDPIFKILQEVQYFVLSEPRTISYFYGELLQYISLKIFQHLEKYLLSDNRSIILNLIVSDMNYDKLVKMKDGSATFDYLLQRTSGKREHVLYLAVQGYSQRGSFEIQSLKNVLSFVSDDLMRSNILNTLFRLMFETHRRLNPFLEILLALGVSASAENNLYLRLLARHEDANRMSNSTLPFFDNALVLTKYGASLEDAMNFAEHHKEDYYIWYILEEWNYRVEKEKEEKA